MAEILTREDAIEQIVRLARIPKRKHDRTQFQRKLRKFLCKYMRGGDMIRHHKVGTGHLHLLELANFDVSENYKDWNEK